MINIFLQKCGELGKKTPLKDTINQKAKPIEQ